MKTYSLFDPLTKVVTNTMSMPDGDLFIEEHAKSMGLRVYHGDATIGSIISEDGLSIIGTATTMADIARSIEAGGGDLDTLVSKLPDVLAGITTPSAWKSKHYEALRGGLYPPIEDLADALVKTNSSDESLRQQGAAELQTYVDKCLAVKAAIPKG